MASRNNTTQVVEWWSSGSWARQRVGPRAVADVRNRLRLAASGARGASTTTNTTPHTSPEPPLLCTCPRCTLGIHTVGGAGRLAQAVKAYQRAGEAGKQEWAAYTDQYLGGVRDPARHDIDSLQQFCDSFGLTVGPGAQRHAPDRPWPPHPRRFSSGRRPGLREWASSVHAGPLGAVGMCLKRTWQPYMLAALPAVVLMWKETDMRLLSHASLDDPHRRPAMLCLARMVRDLAACDPHAKSSVGGGGQARRRFRIPTVSPLGIAGLAASYPRLLAGTLRRHFLAARSAKASPASMPWHGAQHLRHRPLLLPTTIRDGGVPNPIHRAAGQRQLAGNRTISTARLQALCAGARQP